MQTSSGFRFFALLALCAALMFGVFILAILIRYLSRSMSTAQDSRGGNFPYKKQDSLFSAAEREFMAVLEQALGPQCRVFGKVRLADIIQVASGVSGPIYQKAFNQIRSKHVDFVVCDPATMTIQFVAELDDSSHQRPDRQRRDAFLDQALEAAGVLIYHFPVRKAYSVTEIREILSK